MEEMKEKEDKEQRKSSLVVFNIPESGKETSLEKEEEDKGRCMKVI